MLARMDDGEFLICPSNYSYLKVANFNCQHKVSSEKSYEFILHSVHDMLRTKYVVREVWRTN